MPVIVKLDEDLPRRAADAFTSAAYEVRTVQSQGWSGTPDDELFPLVQAEGVFWVTADKGFGDIRSYPPGTHRGILLLRPQVESAVAFAGLVEEFLANHSLDTHVGALVVVTNDRVRVRRA